LILRTILIGLTTIIGGIVVGGVFFSAPKYRGPKSDHFDGDRFQNLVPARAGSLRGVLRMLAERQPSKWDQWREIAPAPPPPQRVKGGELRVTWVNHATMLIQTEGLNILTDPIWSDRCSPVSWAGPKRHHAPGIRFEDLPPIDVVLVSHNHYDHMDVPTLDALRLDHDPRVFVALGNSAFLKGATDLDWWQSVEVAEGVRIHAVPAQHFSSRGMRDRNANLWTGFVVETPHGNIYFAGDTGWGPHFQLIRDRFGPMRLAMLPIGAYEPSWFMSPVHISPGEAVRAAQILEAETSIPMHYFTFKLSNEGQEEPVEVLKREAIDGVRFEVLEPGKTWSAEATPPLSNARQDRHWNALRAGPESGSAADRLKTAVLSS